MPCQPFGLSTVAVTVMPHGGEALHGANCFVQGHQRLYTSQGPGRLVLPLSDSREDAGAPLLKTASLAASRATSVIAKGQNQGRVPLKAPSAPPIVPQGNGHNVAEGDAPCDAIWAAGP